MAYNKSSPYFGTPVTNGYLDVWNPPAITKYADDIPYTLQSQYSMRPDLLAYDLYGDVKLWWVFAARNPNAIEDPIFDFVSGVTIYLPKLSTLKQDLGI
jgi:hypothetical protein